MIPWAIQSMEFSRPEYWSEWPFPSPGDLPNPGSKSRSPAFQVDSLPAEPQGKPKNTVVRSLSLLQRIFLIQELNQSLLHCRWIHYQLSYRSLENISCVFPIVFLRFWIIFTILILNSFSGRLPISTSFTCSPGVLAYPFIWDVTFWIFMLIYFLYSGGDGITVELFQILKDDAVKVLHSICQQI